MKAVLLEMIYGCKNLEQPLTTNQEGKVTCIVIRSWQDKLLHSNQRNKFIINYDDGWETRNYWNIS